MFLASALRDHETELRADLQRYYGLNLDMMGESYSVQHAAACAVCLPCGSALVGKMNPDYALALRDFPILALLGGRGGEDGIFADAQEMGVEELMERLDSGWRDAGGGRVFR